MGREGREEGKCEVKFKIEVLKIYITNKKETVAILMLNNIGFKFKKQ